MEKLLAAVAFMNVLLFALAFYYLFKDQKERRRQVLMTRLGRGVENHASHPHKVTRPRSTLVRLAAGILDPAPLEALIIASGVPLSMERFFTLSLGLALALGLTAGLVLHSMPAALAVMAAGGALPYLYLLRCRKRRQQKLVQQLPDALAMIVRALRAGQSVDAALKEIANSSDPPVGDEMRIVYEEIAMGLSFEQALRNFETRFSGVADIKIICAAFIIQRETGGNLTKILAGLADTIRGRFKLKRQVRALTAEGRTSAFILGLLPLFFAAVTWLVNPKYISLLAAHPLGRKLLILAVVLVAAGFGVMRMMIRIDA